MEQQTVPDFVRDLPPDAILLGMRGAIWAGYWWHWLGATKDGPGRYMRGEVVGEYLTCRQILLKRLTPPTLWEGETPLIWDAVRGAGFQQTLGWKIGLSGPMDVEKLTDQQLVDLYTHFCMGD